MQARFLGIEIGASKHQAVLFDKDLGVLQQSQGTVNLEQGAQGILAWMQKEIVPLLEQVAVIGVGFGGIIETATGTSCFSVQVEGWDRFPIQDWFQDTFGVPVWVANDTVAGGYAEYRMGAGQEARRLFYTNIGSGIGGAFITAGSCDDGLGYGAAYFGHTWAPDPFTGSRGARNKVENLCSGFGIEKRLRQSGYVPKSSLLSQMPRETLNCRELADAARKGDTFALLEIDQIAEVYAVGLSNVITLYSPDRVVIGGGVAQMGSLLFEPIRKYTDMLVFAPDRGRYTIVPSILNDLTVPLGAALLAKEMIYMRKIHEPWIDDPMIKE